MKEKIPRLTILEVWLRNCCKYDKRICQCSSCTTVLVRPLSLKNEIDEVYENERFRFHDDYSVKPERHAEMGHVISEKNGGSIHSSNLIVQCSYCNKTNGGKDININQLYRDIHMVDLSQ